MLPDEEDNRATIKQVIPAAFLASGRILREGRNLLRDLTTHKIKGPLEEGRIALIGLLSRELRRYRSIELLLEGAFSEPSNLLTRSMFEGLLAVRFISGKFQPAHLRSTSLRNRLQPLQKAGVSLGPKGCLKRTAMIVGYVPLKLARTKTLGYKPKPAAVPLEKYDEVKKASDEVIAAVGEDVAKAMARCGCSGLSIDLYAELCGLSEYYSMLYGQLSFDVHANFVSSYLLTQDGGTFVQLGGNSEKTRRSHSLASCTFSMILADIAALLGKSLDKGLIALCMEIDADLMVNRLLEESLAPSR